MTSEATKRGSKSRGRQIAEAFMETQRPYIDINDGDDKSWDGFTLQLAQFLDDALTEHRIEER